MKHPPRSGSTPPEPPERPELDGRRRGRRRRARRRHRRHHDRAAARGGGRRVVLLEANRLARGVTRPHDGQGLLPARDDLLAAASKFGAEAARTYGAANEAALDWMPGARRDGIDCDLRRRPPTRTYAEGEDRAQAEQEADAATGPGCPARSSTSTPLPYGVAAAVRFDDQAEFHPRKYLLGLAERRLAGGRSSSDSRATADGQRRGPASSRRPAAASRADTSWSRPTIPFLDRTLAFARVHPQRSYALVCRIADEPPPGMFICARLADALGPRRAARRRGAAAGRRRGPQDGHGRRHRGALRARSRSSPASTGRSSRSSTAGPRRTTPRSTSSPTSAALTPRTDRLLMATGFAKWGMTGGTAAAMILADRVLGRAESVGGAVRPQPAATCAPRRPGSSRRTPRPACTSSATA